MPWKVPGKAVQKMKPDHAWEGGNNQKDEGSGSAWIGGNQKDIGGGGKTYKCREEKKTNKKLLGERVKARGAGVVKLKLAGRGRRKIVRTSIPTKGGIPGVWWGGKGVLRCWVVGKDAKKGHRLTKCSGSLRPGVSVKQGKKTAT